MEEEEEDPLEELEEEEEEEEDLLEGLDPKIQKAFEGFSGVLADIAKRLSVIEASVSGGIGHGNSVGNLDGIGGIGGIGRGVRAPMI